MAFKLENLVRENVKHLKPYSSARHEFTGIADIFLDANENSFGSPIDKNYHRYPDPLQSEIKHKISILQNVKDSQIFIGNGSDEAIDLLFRIFCEPKKDNVVICPPTYGMYEVSANINDVSIKRANLTENFQLDLQEIRNQIDEHTKLLFICSPNNPTGNAFVRKQILELASSFNGIVVVDEAYIHFSKEKTFVSEINSLPNLVVLQTFSKAWGLAGLRVGIAFGNEEIIKFFNRVKPPYNVSQIAQETVLKALANQQKVAETVEKIVKERNKLIEDLQENALIKKVFPTDANFILVKTSDSTGIYNFLLAEKIVVRHIRNNIALCGDYLRITVGTPSENTELLKALKNYEKSIIY